MNREYILVINPGSTSTKVALFKEDQSVKQKNLTHPNEELEKFAKITDQYDYRKDIILNWLEEEGVELQHLAAVVGRGGLLRPMPSGTYKVTEAMIEDLRIGVQGEHASNLGGIIAKSIADSQGIPSFIVDPVAVDEFEDVARISGIPDIPRKSLVHALNIRAVARRAAKDMDKGIDDINIVAAHLGGGMSIAALKRGNIIDASSANDDGPFSPDRPGGLPTGEVIKMCYSGKYGKSELKKKIIGKSGFVGYLGTNDGREVEEMIAKGDKKADLIHDAMAYKISKLIGSMAAVLDGDIQAVVLTGGLAHSKLLCERIEKRVKFIAPFMVYPGEFEMQALSEGALRVLTGKEKVKIYEDEVKSSV